MSDSVTSRPRSRSRTDNQTGGMYSPPQRASRRLAGQKPEIEVIKRSRGLSSPPLNNDPISYQKNEPKAYYDAPDDHQVVLLENASYFPPSSEFDPIPNGEKEDSEVNILDVSVHAMDTHDQVEYAQVPIFDDSMPFIDQSQTSHPPIDSIAYWESMLAGYGIEKLTLLLGQDQSPNDDDVVTMSDPSGDKKKKSSKSSSSKKKSSKKPPPIEPEEEIIFTEEDRLEQQLRERNNEFEALKQLHSTVSKLSGMMMSENDAPFPRAVARTVSDLLDEVIFEIIQDTHYCLLTDSEEATRMLAPRSGNGVDIFGQDTASIRTDSFLCGNLCGRLISSNRYAPHLEKCTGLSGAKMKPTRRAGVD